MNWVIYGAVQIGTSLTLIILGAHLMDRYGQILGYRMRAPTNDPHQHCDRHPVNCTYRKRITETMTLLERYSGALDAVAQCERCPGCALTAKAAKATNYEPD
jgi:hypothetical protein